MKTLFNSFVVPSFVVLSFLVPPLSFHFVVQFFCRLLFHYFFYWRFMFTSERGQSRYCSLIVFLCFRIKQSINYCSHILCFARRFESINQYHAPRQDSIALDHHDTLSLNVMLCLHRHHVYTIFCTNNSIMLIQTFVQTIHLLLNYLLQLLNLESQQLILFCEITCDLSCNFLREKKKLGHLTHNQHREECHTECTIPTFVYFLLLVSSFMASLFLDSFYNRQFHFFSVCLLSSVAEKAIDLKVLML